MTKQLEIRESVPNDLAAIEELYPGAFPDEDLLPLVRELLKRDDIVVSLVGLCEHEPLGHVLFTTCGIEGKADKVALLGPLAVMPVWQRRGIGGALVRAGLQKLETAGFGRVCVLGDPAYYSRFGFAADDGLKPPYALPDEWRGAWQSLAICKNDASLEGKLIVPQPWRQRALWVS